jgi:ATP-dependent protease ClpP protease subunit/uncharacterized protein (UPF0332 family)
VAIPNPNFRPDVNRSICIFGEITEELVSRTSREIIRFRESGYAPITVLINSIGGDPRAIEHIYDILTVRGPFGRKPRIITVAVGEAKSAAANILALGDYAAAFPRASIHFHGLRYAQAEEVTVEYASAMASQLDLRNRETASSLARAGTVRLAFQFARLKSKFDNIRKAFNKPDLSDMECLVVCLEDLLSVNGKRIANKAIQRWRHLQELSRDVMAKAIGSGKKGVEFGGLVLRNIVNYEVKNLKKLRASEFGEDAAFRIVSNWLLLRNYDLGKHISVVKVIAKRFPDSFFTKDQIAQITAQPKDPQAEAMVHQVMNLAIKPFCYFASCIWEALQEDENPLSPTDAYALGVVDEVYGSRLACLRETMEAQTPQQPNLNLPSSSGPSQPSEQSPPSA